MANNANTPLVGQFLVAINGFIIAQNVNEIRSYFVLEPPFSGHYVQMIAELRRAYPRGGDDALLEQKCSAALSTAREGVDGSPTWTPFIRFMAQYLGFLRDVDSDPSKYLETWKLLSELQTRANSALVHPTLGHLILPVVISCAKAICRLAIGLDKNPALLAGLGGPTSSEPEGPRESLPERAVNLLRNAFTTCLNDRTSGLDKAGVPQGKKRGIYTIANICLKALFQSQKTRNAKEIFESIGSLSPPLSAYPKSERVTYLYYLGRFLFQNSHFYRASEALQQAYDESPTADVCIRQRRLILIFLISSNLILGRFPSQTLLQRPEAHGLQDRFMPLMLAIRRGDLPSFRRHLDYNSPHAPWFLHFRILLQLRNRCLVLIWRSLVRKTWLLNGTRPAPPAPGKPAPAPQVNLHDLIGIFTYLEKASASTLQLQQRQQQQPRSIIDRDFIGVDFASDSPTSTSSPTTTTTPPLDLRAIESKLGSLIAQGLIHGYISHASARLVILGAKEATNDAEILDAGFPRPWAAVNKIVGRTPAHKLVPGWKRDSPVAAVKGFGGGPGPGMVINLSGAKAVG